MKLPLSLEQEDASRQTRSRCFLSLPCFGEALLPYTFPPLAGKVRTHQPGKSDVGAGEAEVNFLFLFFDSSSSSRVNNGIYRKDSGKPNKG